MPYVGKRPAPAPLGAVTSTDLDSAIDDLVDAAPGTLDTLNELAAALGDDPNFATTVTNSIATKASNTYVNTQLDTKVDETHTGNVSITGTILINDNGASGATPLEVRGGGTSTGTPANNENTMFLKARSGTTSLSTGIGFWGTFDNFPADTNHRRAADIRAGYYSGGGTWGGEYISFNVGNGSGASNDAAAMTTERVRITKDAMTANVSIEDTAGDVRQAPVTAVSSTPYTIPSGSSGLLFRLATGASTINVDMANFDEGDVVTLVNIQGTTKTLSFSAWTNGVRIAGGDGTNYSSSTLTLAGQGVVTLIAISGNRLTVNGNVS